jgi:hypothetical protein
MPCGKPKVEREFEVVLLVKVKGFGKEHHENQLVGTVADLLGTALGEVEVERIPVGDIVLP